MSISNKSGKTALLVCFLAATITFVGSAPTEAASCPNLYYSTTSCPTASGTGPCYKYVATGNTFPGNPSLGINYYKEYKKYANAYYLWQYVGLTTKAC